MLSNMMTRMEYKTTKTRHRVVPWMGFWNMQGIVGKSYRNLTGCSVLAVYN